MSGVFGKPWFSWKQVACLLITVAVLILIFSRIDRREFGAALLNMKPGWWVLALGCYGAAFLFAAWRWHLALRVVGCSVHAAASTRLAYIGHFFFIVFFGGVVGDIAKSTLYCRWYRFSFPEVFAASPLDRLMGLAGLMLFGLVAFVFATAHQSLAHVQRLSFTWPSTWVVALGILALALVAALFRWEPRGESSTARMGRAIRGGAAGLLATPTLALHGLLCGFIVQMALSGTLALNVQAITHDSLPWSKMLWTFPVISVLSSLPVSVAGLGVREGAAIFFLGLYGVSPSDAVAASLLSLSVSLLWAGVGGAIFWREGARLERQPIRSPAATLSVIIPALNEAESLPETVRRVQQIPAVKEVIVVDGGSRDRTRHLAAQLGCRVVESPPGRGGQLRRGAALAQGDVVIFLHADTWLPVEAGEAALRCLRDPVVVGGGFWKVFRSSPLLLLGSRSKCAIRLYLGRRIAGDQALFVRREVLESVGGVPDLPLMEEFELCRRLRRIGRLALADATIVTSARRFAQHGVLRTYFRMWWVTTLYRMGRPPAELREIYERK